MDTTISQKEHRYRHDDSRVSLRGNIYTPPEPSRAKQRCCHGLFFLYLLITLIVSIASLVLLLTANAGENGSKLFTTCVLFGGAGELPLSAKEGVWACDLIFAAKVLVILFTGLLILVSLIYVCKGVKVLSPCRIADTIIHLVLAILSFVVGVLIDAGLTITCQREEVACTLTESWTSVNNTMRTAEYSSYVVGVAFLGLSLINFLLSMLYCYQHASREMEESTTPLLASAPVSYSSLRRKHGSNPFTDDHHV